MALFVFIIHVQSAKIWNYQYKKTNGISNLIVSWEAHKRKSLEVLRARIKVSKTVQIAVPVFTGNLSKRQLANQ